ncbi:Oidioi.mRNA.OKI2018_I69.PAR.g9478.t1.cds [Oikopleura dioica]|uniref:Oidioi.mRNA.OKI2018_I69.PAR.g9478.t1.cds n=1 Tax=Oikopleura dioica TaxID=34765 RepID=A0ABN7RPX3_OIKDI|nr:Oidioi.mRNA.OKI2018_I69.PAR.g9478.t1.cds [Oikopleura dioica]
MSRRRNQQQQVIDPAELDIPQLEQFKGGLQAELQSIQGAIQEMSQANESLMMAQLSCDQVKDTILEKDLDVMVPMTNFLFVRGKLIPEADVMVDLEMIEMSPEKATEHFSRRGESLKTHLSRVGETMSVKEIQFIRISKELEERMQQLSIQNKMNFLE